MTQKDRPKIFKKSGKVNAKFSVELTLEFDGIKPVSLKAVWSPRMPAGGELELSDLDRYVRIRDAVIANLSAAIGKGVLVLE